MFKKRIWVLVLAVAAMFALTACGGGDDDASGPTGDAGGNFSGDKGDFVVTPNQTAAFPCDEQASILLEEAQFSPLYSSQFDPEAEVSTCANGTVISIKDVGAETLTRRLFVGDAVVPYSVPENRLETTDIDGCPAIVQLPEADDSPTRRVTVLEQAPEGDDDGVLVILDNTALDEQEAAAFLEPFVNDC
jgi:hypothetical protein